MRIIIEDSSESNTNKRRTAVECESDEVGIDEAMDMLLRSLTAYGYRRDAISAYFTHIISTYDEKPTEEESTTDEGLENAYADQEQLPSSE